MKYGTLKSKIIVGGKKSEIPENQTFDRKPSETGSET